jgi:hypothetical protein
MKTERVLMGTCFGMGLVDKGCGLASGDNYTLVAVWGTCVGVEMDSGGPYMSWMAEAGIAKVPRNSILDVVG